MDTLEEKIKGAIEKELLKAITNPKARLKDRLDAVDQINNFKLDEYDQSSLIIKAIKKMMGYEPRKLFYRLPTPNNQEVIYKLIRDGIHKIEPPIRANTADTILELYPKGSYPYDMAFSCYFDD
ncbi:MAG: hypothetical protein PHE43_02785 [Candidatus Nanoarchaeia archaeon]|nr:hypothetical protein [Candidatus Nanoarchaeia archaeon]